MILSIVIWDCCLADCYSVSCYLLWLFCVLIACYLVDICKSWIVGLWFCCCLIVLWWCATRVIWIYCWFKWFCLVDWGLLFVFAAFVLGLYCLFFCFFNAGWLFWLFDWLFVLVNCCVCCFCLFDLIKQFWIGVFVYKYDYVLLEDLFLLDVWGCFWFCLSYCLMVLFYCVYSFISLD